MSASPSVTCPVCQRTSHCRHDIDQSFCGACHIWWKLDPDAPAGYVIVDREEVPGAEANDVERMSNDEESKLRAMLDGLGLSREESSLGFFILDQDRNVVALEEGSAAAQTIAWARWMQAHRAECTVKQELLFGHFWLSTRFLGIDMSVLRFFRDEPPLAFETMAFEQLEQDRRIVAKERCHTWQQAEVQHERVKRELLRVMKG